MSKKTKKDTSNKTVPSSKDLVIQFSIDDLTDVFLSLTKELPYIRAVMSKGRLKFIASKESFFGAAILSPFGHNPESKTKNLEKMIKKREDFIHSWCNRISDIWNYESKELSEKGIPTIFLKYNEDQQ